MCEWERLLFGPSLILWSHAYSGAKVNRKSELLKIVKDARLIYYQLTCKIIHRKYIDLLIDGGCMLCCLM